jgi:hypothetical protein
LESFTGLSGGGVARCDIGLKLLRSVSGRFQYAQDGVLLFRQLVAMQQFLELAKSVVKVLGGSLALDLVVQDAHGSLRCELLVRGQGRGRGGRFGRGEGDDVCWLLARKSEAGEGAMLEQTSAGEGGPLTGREGDDGGKGRVGDGLIHRGGRPECQSPSMGGRVPVAVLVPRHGGLGDKTMQVGWWWW